MNELRHRLNEISSLSFGRLGLDTSKALFMPSQRPELSDFQCNAALAIAKEKQANPINLADTISQALELNFKSAGIELSIKVDGPGFINVRLADTFIAEVLKRFEPDVSAQTDEPETIIIDYGGPNIAKSLHIGHIRTSIVGESIKRILRAQGHKVYGDIHWGDWGTHMGILIAYLEEKNPDWPYFNNGNYDGHCRYAQ